MNQLLWICVMGVLYMLGCNNTAFKPKAKSFKLLEHAYEMWFQIL